MERSQEIHIYEFHDNFIGLLQWNFWAQVLPKIFIGLSNNSVANLVFCWKPTIEPTTTTPVIITTTVDICHSDNECPPKAPCCSPFGHCGNGPEFCEHPTTKQITNLPISTTTAYNPTTKPTGIPNDII